MPKIGLGRGIDGVYAKMNAMDRLVILYWSCIGLPVPGDAFMFLGTETAITLAGGSEKWLRR